MKVARTWSITHRNNR